MNLPLLFLFSGQGSHYYQMGRELYEHNAVFRQWFMAGDAIVRERCGISIAEFIYDDRYTRGDSFDQIQFSHPAIFLVEVATAQTLMDTGFRPAVVLGSSLGVFAAWVIAGTLDFADALRAVLNQAEVVAACCPPGGMLAVMASPELYSKEKQLFAGCEVAGVNFDEHFVVSGPVNDLANCENTLRTREIHHQRLPVSYAFHSHLIDPAARPHRTFLRDLALSAPRIPILPVPAGELHHETLWNAIRRPEDFRAVVRDLEERSYGYVDVGPSGTLATFVKYNLSPDSASLVFPIITRFGRERSNIARLTALD